jgi:hypothetical protein
MDNQDASEVDQFLSSNSHVGSSPVGMTASTGLFTEKADALDTVVASTFGITSVTRSASSINGTAGHGLGNLSSASSDLANNGDFGEYEEGNVARLPTGCEDDCIAAGQACSDWCTTITDPATLERAFCQAGCWGLAAACVYDCP